MTGSQSGKILIADDDAHTRNLLRELLESWGYQVAVAEDGEQALASAKEIPDLALLDLMMPKLDGFGVLKQLRECPDTANIPVILLTAAGEVDEKLKGIELGADDYVTKPFRIVDLQERVEAALEKKRRQSAEDRPTEDAPADPLTGVGTFPQLKETLVYEVERAKRYARPLAALMVGVDESPLAFQRLDRAETNDVLGRLAESLRKSFRTADRLFRIDVEAFVVLMPETTSEGALVAALRLAHTLKLEPLLAHGQIRFTVSVGVADFPRFGRAKADDLVRAAHHALQRAQRGGPGSVELAVEGEMGD
jgi:diguanylate cyclase (GGDEF)-like protein